MESDMNTMNIPEVSVDEMIGELFAMYNGALREEMPLRELPSPFLWGPPGVGKSEGVRQLAADLEKCSGRTVVVSDVRLLLFSPVDLRGVPMADAQKQLAVWLKPEIFNMDPSESIINILLLDELSAAPQSVQAAAYQLTLDRRIGEHKLPENCIVIAAGNRATDQSVAYKMPKALANRMMHFVVRSDFRSWKDWALNHGIDSRIIGYLSFENSKLCQEPEASDLAYPTPRSWTFVNSMLRTAGNPIPMEKLHRSICACIGTDSAIAFESWCRVYEQLPDTEAILRGTCREYPRTQDVLYALSASLLTALRERRETISQTALDNVCQYVSRFPADFAAAFFRDLIAMKEEGLHLKLMKCWVMQEWVAKNKKYL